MFSFLLSWPKLHIADLAAIVLIHMTCVTLKRVSLQNTSIPQIFQYNFLLAESFPYNMETNVANFTINDKISKTGETFASILQKETSAKFSVKERLNYRETIQSDIQRSAAMDVTWKALLSPERK